MSIVRVRLFSVLTLLSLLPVGSSLFAQEKALQKEPEIADAEIESWVQDLGSANFDEREIATQKLLDLGQRALPFLEKAVKSSKESEIRWNAKRLLREIREAGRPAPPRTPRTPRWGVMPEERDGRMEDLFREMERQQQEMRRMMEEHFRHFQGGEREAWPFDSGFDFDKLGHGGGGRFFSLQQGRDGVRVEIRETVDGKEQKQVYEASSPEEFREKYPEIAEKHGIGAGPGGGWHFSFGDRPRLQPRVRVQLPSAPEDRLGVEVDAVEPALASYLDIAEGVGLIVRGAEKGSLAEKMGIKEKDVLLSINGKDIRGRETILTTLRQTASGGEIIVEVQRAGAGKMTLKGTKPATSEAK